MPDTNMDQPPPGPYDRSIEPRVSRLEADMQDVRGAVMRLDQTMARVEATLNATLPHLATKAEVREIREIKAMLEATLPHLATKAELAEKPGKAYLWAVLAVLITAYGAGLAALAVLR